MNIDPRFTTQYTADYKGPLFYQKFNPEKLPTVYLPASVTEVWCEPGYQKKQPNKGVELTVNDYREGHKIFYGGGLWPKYVFTPFKDNN